jgi:hypothetical protein
VSNLIFLIFVYEAFCMSNAKLVMFCLSIESNCTSENATEGVNSMQCIRRRRLYMYSK